MVSESDGTACDVLLNLIGGPAAANAYLANLGIKDISIATTEKEMGRDNTAQYRNWSTPHAMIGILRIFQEGKTLSPPSRDLLLQLMIHSGNDGRIKGRLPGGTVVAHKTGSSGTKNGVTAATNDVGLVTLPDGKHLAIAVFVSDSRAEEAEREIVIAEAARAIWDWSTSKANLNR